MKTIDFDRLNLETDITMLHGIDTGNMKQVRTGGSIELHGRCPFGGIADNTGFWIYVDRHPMTWFCRHKGECVSCSGGGDAMQFIAVRDHLNRKTDAVKIAETIANETGIDLFTFAMSKAVPAAAPGSMGKQITRKTQPRTPTPPPVEWQRIVMPIVDHAAAALYENNQEAAAALEYLHNRGISDKEIRRHKIGYIPMVNKYFGYSVNLADGQRMYRKPAAGETFIRVPEGITIPTLIDGQLYRVKVRMMDHRAKEKAEADNQRDAAKAAAEGKPAPKPKTEHDCRYSHISGGRGTSLFNADAATDVHPRHDIIFCEGELDALLINSIMDYTDCGQLQAVTFGSATNKPAYETFYKWFRLPKRIIICFDNDKEGNTGAAALQQVIAEVSSRKEPAQIKTLPEPYKDFGEYYAAGGNIEQLLCEWFPY